MCDGYVAFARAFDTKIDLRGYEIASNAVENASEVANTGQTTPKGDKTTLRGLLRAVTRFRG